jgi:hypothetical protein
VNEVLGSPFSHYFSNGSLGPPASEDAAVHRTPRNPRRPDRPEGIHTRLFTVGLRQESSIPQKRNAGKDTAESTSVETVASRQRSASASRVAWACAAYSTAYGEALYNQSGEVVSEPIENIFEKALGH